MEKVKTIAEILNIVEEIGTEFPPNVYMRLEFEDIDNDDDIRKLANQEKANLFEPTPSVPYLWLDWDIERKLNVTIRGKKKNYVLG